jgi:hypothetical protein
MKPEKFSRREVDRAFRKFKDLCNDLFQAKFQTWADSFTHLITHCEQNPVMRAVTEPLRTNKAVDARRWYEEAMASVSSMVGSGNYRLPVDDDDRTALLYQFFLLIETENIDITDFCVAVYGSTKYQEMVYHFNQELVVKFSRELFYRLDEIVEDIGEATEVPREAMYVFHYHGPTTTIQGGIHGSNVGIAGSTVAESSATYQTGADLAEAIRALTPLVGEITQPHRAVVEAALQTLADTAAGEPATPEQIAEAVRNVSEASPTLRERLKKIGGQVGTTIAGSAVTVAIKSLFGIN